MLSFQSIKEFIDAFWREDKLMTALFDKRNLRVRYDDALLFVEEKEERLEFLIQRSVILKNGEYIEFDSRYLDFFEDILDVNAEINISYIQENIENIKVNIAFYLEENSETRKYNYLRKIKSDIRKIGRTIIRNVIDLGRNIEDIYKTEPTYKIKIAKLERYDTKANDVSKLIEVTHGLIFEKEQLFFKVAMDEELKRIKDELRLNLHDGLNNLIEIQKQVIEYLNQIKRPDDFLIKLQKVKRLKDQFELKAKTNLRSVLENLNPVTFEPNPVYSLKLSPEILETEIAFELIKKIQTKISSGNKLKLPVASEFSSDFLSAEVESEVIIDLDALKNGFTASGRDLFDYVMLYDYPKDVKFGEKVTVYCQLISLFPEVMNVTETYALSNDIEYVMVYPKQAR